MHSHVELWAVTSTRFDSYSVRVFETFVIEFPVKV